jgi:hypothetical protein
MIGMFKIPPAFYFEVRIPVVPEVLPSVKDSPVLKFDSRNFKSMKLALKWFHRELEQHSTSVGAVNGRIVLKASDIMEFLYKYSTIVKVTLNY